MRLATATKSQLIAALEFIEFFGLEVLPMTGTPGVYVISIKVRVKSSSF